MNKKEIVLLSLVLIVFCVLTVNVVFEALTGSKLFEIRNPKTVFNIIQNEQVETPRSDVCSTKEKLDIKDKSDNHLIQINKYQEICQSLATDTAMIFIDMPKDKNIAKESAKSTSETLKKFHEAGLSPIVIVEPVTDWGLIDFNEFGTGFYDDWLETFFDTLKSEGIESKHMGLWVPFPEANLPLWNHANTTPEVYSKLVNRYLKILKSEYPDTKTGILLNSATYELDDFDWTSGEYVSLVPYVKNIDKNLVDSFGLQGFPWAPRAGQDESGSVFNASEFLTSKLVEEAAKELGVKEIWLNTGTFGAKYTQDPESTTFVSPNVRLDMLNAILDNASKLESKGFDVTINIFAQDKSNTLEATDWSYLSESFSGNSETESIFVKFVSLANTKGIKISIFDRIDN